MSQKIIALYAVQNGMRIVSGAQYPRGAIHLEEENVPEETFSDKPHQSIFYDEGPAKTHEEQLEAEKPQLSSINLKRKLFNNRLINDSDALKSQINGVTKDISEISHLILSLEKYRSTVSEFKHGTQNTKVVDDPQQQQKSEGILGKVPEATESIAELMLFDSDINVYGDLESAVETDRAKEWQKKKESKRQ